jgi:hypothetical protein
VALCKTYLAIFFLHLIYLIHDWLNRVAGEKWTQSERHTWTPKQVGQHVFLTNPTALFAVRRVCDCGRLKPLSTSGLVFFKADYPLQQKFVGDTHRVFFILAEVLVSVNHVLDGF